MLRILVILQASKESLGSNGGGPPPDARGLLQGLLVVRTRRAVFVLGAPSGIGMTVVDELVYFAGPVGLFGPIGLDAGGLLLLAGVFPLRE